jgi:anaerobic selenocysteine-containing dehydrogenase
MRSHEISKHINARHGRNSIATYLGNPTVHNSGALLFAPGFLRSLHTRNKFSATSVDQLAHHVAAYLMFGHQLLLSVPDVDRTNFFLILGANPAVSNGSMMTAPGMSHRLQEIPPARRQSNTDRSASKRNRTSGRRTFLHPSRIGRLVTPCSSERYF